MRQTRIPPINTTETHSTKRFYSSRLKNRIIINLNEFCDAFGGFWTALITAKPKQRAANSLWRFSVFNSDKVGGWGWVFASPVGGWKMGVGLWVSGSPDRTIFKPTHPQNTLTTRLQHAHRQRNYKAERRLYERTMLERR